MLERPVDYKQIDRLSQMIPLSNSAPASVPPTAQTLAGRFLFYYQSPDLLWKMATALAASNAPFPVWPEGKLKWLWHAWGCQTRKEHWHTREAKAVDTARAIFENPSRSMRDKLEALLLAQDSTIKKVADLTNFPYEVIEAYEALFWNLKDRRKDMLMLSEVVYPNTRLDEILPSYFDKGNLGSMLRRTGYNKSLKEVLWFSGMSRHYADDMSMEAASKHFQRELLVTGWILAANGFLNHSTAHSTLSASRGLIQAAKIGGVDDSGNHDTSTFEEVMMNFLHNDSRELSVMIEKKHG